MKMFMMSFVISLSSFFIRMRKYLVLKQSSPSLISEIFNEQF